MESSYFNLHDAFRYPDVVFKSPELIERRAHHYPVSEVDIDNIGVRSCEDSDNECNATRKISSGSDRVNAYNNDCCECNTELRQDIERLKHQVSRLDHTVNVSMKTIVTMLERSFRYQSGGRKDGIAPLSYSDHDGNANTTV